MDILPQSYSGRYRIPEVYVHSDPDPLDKYFIPVFQARLQNRSLSSAEYDSSRRQCREGSLFMYLVAGQWPTNRAHGHHILIPPDSSSSDGDVQASTSTSPVTNVSTPDASAHTSAAPAGFDNGTVRGCDQITRTQRAGPSVSAARQAPARPRFSGAPPPSEVGSSPFHTRVSPANVGVSDAPAPSIDTTVTSNTGTAHQFILTSSLRGSPAMYVPPALRTAALPSGPYDILTTLSPYTSSLHVFGRQLRQWGIQHMRGRAGLTEAQRERENHKFIDGKNSIKIPFELDDGRPEMVLVELMAIMSQLDKAANVASPFCQLAPGTTRFSAKGPLIKIHHRSQHHDSQVRDCKDDNTSKNAKVRENEDSAEAAKNTYSLNHDNEPLADLFTPPDDNDTAPSRPCYSSADTHNGEGIMVLHFNALTFHWFIENVAERNRWFFRRYYREYMPISQNPQDNDEWKSSEEYLPLGFKNLKWRSGIDIPPSPPISHGKLEEDIKDKGKERETKDDVKGKGKDSDAEEPQGCEMCRFVQAKIRSNRWMEMPKIVLKSEGGVLRWWN